MRIIGVFALLIAVIGVYLNQTYAAFFNNIDIANLRPPSAEIEIQINTKIATQKTYTFIGDSLTAGVGATSQKTTLPYLVGQKLAGTNPALIRNLGYPGARAKNLITIAENEQNEHSDFVIIFIGINDLFNRTPINDFSQDLDKTIKMLNKPNTQLAIVTIPFLGTNKSVPFPYDYLYHYQLTKYNKAIKSAAENNQIRLVDITELARYTMVDPESFAADYFHPSDNGYILLADLIANELNK